MTRNDFERRNIEILQRYLRQLSYFEELTPVPVDGIYGSETAEAVREFQRRAGLPVTGLVDRETWDAIYLAYLASIAENSPPERVSIFPRIPKNYAITEGESWFLIEILQYMLIELSRDYDRFGPLEISGVYDGATVAAVRDFQGRNGLPVTGEVDKATWNAIVNQYNKAAEDYVQ